LSAEKHQGKAKKILNLVSPLSYRPPHGTETPIPFSIPRLSIEKHQGEAKKKLNLGQITSTHRTTDN
jgi:hypothetical protein